MSFYTGKIYLNELKKIGAWKEIKRIVNSSQEKKGYKLLKKHLDEDNFKKAGEILSRSYNSGKSNAEKEIEEALVYDHLCGGRIVLNSIDIERIDDFKHKYDSFSKKFVEKNFELILKYVSCYFEDYMDKMHEMVDSEKIFKLYTDKDIRYNTLSNELQERVRPYILEESEKNEISHKLYSIFERIPKSKIHEIVREKNGANIVRKYCNVQQVLELNYKEKITKEYLEIALMLSDDRKTDVFERAKLDGHEAIVKVEHGQHWEQTGNLQGYGCRLTEDGLYTYRSKPKHDVNIKNYINLSAINTIKLKKDEEYRNLVIRTMEYSDNLLEENIPECMKTKEIVDKLIMKYNYEPNKYKFFEDHVTEEHYARAVRVRKYEDEKKKSEFLKTIPNEFITNLVFKEYLQDKAANIKEKAENFLNSQDAVKKHISRQLEDISKFLESGNITFETSEEVLKQDYDYINEILIDNRIMIAGMPEMTFVVKKEEIEFPIEEDYCFVHNEGNNHSEEVDGETSLEDEKLHVIANESFVK